MGSIDQPVEIPVHFQEDLRGVFCKPFANAVRGEVPFVIRELFWTSSAKGTIRGMHFQTPPFETNKLIWVSHGAVMDVLVDLRRGTRFGAVTSVRLDATTGTALWVPAGFAHGFQALEDGALINYAADSPYSPSHDTGILWNSIDFDWPLPTGPISERDQLFAPLASCDAPFEALM